MPAILGFGGSRGGKLARDYRARSSECVPLGEGPATEGAGQCSRHDDPTVRESLEPALAPQDARQAAFPLLDRLNLRLPLPAVAPPPVRFNPPPEGILRPRRIPRTVTPTGASPSIGSAHSRCPEIPSNLTWHGSPRYLKLMAGKPGRPGGSDRKPPIAEAPIPGRSFRRDRCLVPTEPAHSNPVSIRDEPGERDRPGTVRLKVSIRNPTSIASTERGRAHLTNRSGRTVRA
jgi:hypothetical protein